MHFLEGPCPATTFTRGWKAVYSGRLWDSRYCTSMPTRSRRRPNNSAHSRYLSPGGSTEGIRMRSAVSATSSSRSASTRASTRSAAWCPVMASTRGGALSWSAQPIAGRRPVKPAPPCRFRPTAGHWRNALGRRPGIRRPADHFQQEHHFEEGDRSTRCFGIRGRSTGFGSRRGYEFLHHQRRPG